MAFESITNFNSGNEAQPIFSAGTEHVRYDMSTRIGNSPFFPDPSAIDWDDFMSNINVLNGITSPIWPTANVATGMIGATTGPPTATTVEHYPSTQLDPVLDQSNINANNATQVDDGNSSDSPMDNFHGHAPNEIDCFRTVIDVIASLHVPKPTCSLNQPSGIAQVPSMDVVLVRNKQVVHTLERMMSCSCSLDRQLGSLIGIAISKLLNWYAAAAKTDTSQSASHPPRLSSLDHKNMLLVFPSPLVPIKWKAYASRLCVSWL